MGGDSAGSRSTATWAVLGVCALLAVVSTQSSPQRRGQGVTALGPPPTVVATTTTSTSTTTTSTTVATTTVPPPPPAPTTTTTNLVYGPSGPLVAGQWTPIGYAVDGVPTMTATILEGAGVVRLDARVTKLVQYAGSGEPGGSWPNQGAVGTASPNGVLAAAFNAGFHTYESGGGWYDHGNAGVPLRDGAASLIIKSDGTATVGMWGRDASLTPDVVSVRQNLSMLVDGGANLSATSGWGATLGNVLYTWRSALGVDGSGNILWAGGPGQSPYSLAQALIEAGAVRGMETDINPMWVSFSYYSSPTVGTDLLGGMYFGPDHWLYGSARDFFAVFVDEKPARLSCSALATNYLGVCRNNS